MTPTVGRPRDEALDLAILEAAQQLLAERGFEALSIAAVADRAGTTRPAVYRRHPTKLDLAIAACGTLSVTTSPEPTGDHFADLVAELTSFRAAITSASTIALVGTMLQGSVARPVREAYREQVVRPRRTRLLSIIDSAVSDDELRGSVADRDVAVTMCTGSWYGFALAGQAPPSDWPRRTASLIWRALGGVPS